MDDRVQRAMPMLKEHCNLHLHKWAMSRQSK